MNINEITYKINGAIFEVNRILGPGFLEKVIVLKLPEGLVGFHLPPSHGK